MIYILLIFTIIFLILSSAVSLYNLVTKPVLQYQPRPTGSKNRPLVSVLIPARNEAKTIERVLYTLTQQTHRNIEIIVLDDHSEDRTREIAISVAHVEPRLRVMKGKQLPKGWTGKNWACHQLSTEAKGDMLLFLDADVQLAPEAISSAVAEMDKRQLAMLSVFPTQLMQSFGERLIVPLMNWLLLSFLPLRLVANSPDPKFVAANGQFILVTHDAYFEFGGHDTVRDKVVEDMEIARILKRSGKRIMTLLGGDLISCRMYESAGQAADGFTKNFYAGFNISKPIFIIMLFIFVIAFLGPFIAVIENGLFIYAIILIILNRTFISLISQQSFIYNIILHPFQILIMLIIGIRSVEAYSKGQIVWKGRRI